MLTKSKSQRYEQANITYISEQLIIGNTTNERIEVNLCGLKVDEHLSWKAHTYTVANITAKYLGILNRLNIFSLR